MTAEFPIRIPGLAIGHARDVDAKTGVSVFLFDPPAVAAGWLGGVATSTRQADALRPEHVVPAVDAFLFVGGSAYGLDATGGALSWLEAHGRGLTTRHGLVPVCPTAAIYDLGFGRGDLRPAAAMAAAACEAARSDAVAQGSVGAGTGATVGKLYGVAQAMKGGFGAATAEEDELVVQAFVACNAFGDVVDPETGRIIAGARGHPTSFDFIDTARRLAEGERPSPFIKPRPENTVLTAVVANARLDKAQCQLAAKRAEDGIRAAVRPALSPVDGDVVFLAATGAVQADPEAVGRLAACAVAQAIIAAVRHADGFGLVPAWRDREAAKARDGA